MIKFYVNKNQLYNFLELKEPVQLVNNIISEDFFEFTYNTKDVIINTYKTFATVELNSKRKKVKALWQRMKKIIHKKR